MKHLILERFGDMVWWSVSRHNNLIGYRIIWFLTVMVHENYLKVNFSTITNFQILQLPCFSNRIVSEWKLGDHLVNKWFLCFQYSWFWSLYSFNCDLESWSIHKNIKSNSWWYYKSFISDTSHTGHTAAGPQVVVNGGNRLLEVQPHCVQFFYLLLDIYSNTECI